MHDIIQSSFIDDHLAIMPSISLAERPTELIDHVCFFVESPKDLLSLALTAKQICVVAIPNHIECRYIRCNPRHIDLWKKLVELPWVASQFVSLELIDEYCEIGADTAYSDSILPNRHPLLPIPNRKIGIRPRWKDWNYKETWEVDCMNALAAAIAVMSGLKSFRWRIDKPPPMNNLFAALSGCSLLDEVQVIACNQIGDEYWIHHSPLWNLSNLRVFSFTYYDNFDLMGFDIISDYTKSMLDMLVHRCPRLEHLQLCLLHEFMNGHQAVENFIVQLLEQGRWPLLKRLSLILDFDIPQYDVVNMFWNAHPTLERILVPGFAHHQRVYRATDTANVFALSCVGPIQLTTNAFARLDFLGLDLSYGSATNHSKISILSQIPSLRRLSLEGVRYPPVLMVAISRACPRLERLHFNHKDDLSRTLITSYTFDESWKCILEVNDVGGVFSDRVATVSYFHHLTHLSRFLHFQDPVVSDTIIDKVVGSVAAAFPTLKYISLAPKLKYSDEIRKWISIDRDEGGFVMWKALDYEKDLDVNNWGGFFLGTYERRDLIHDR